MKNTSFNSFTFLVIIRFHIQSYLNLISNYLYLQRVTKIYVFLLIHWSSNIQKLDIIPSLYKYAIFSYKIKEILSKLCLIYILQKKWF